MITATSTETLRQIQAMDPDGGQTQPTMADYARFRADVVAMFGPAAWTAYAGDWEPTAEV